ncbi:hypothetical protein L332_03550 [Agrococcus pavilionensis RW1]|uniref:Uncharacterized protein n=1 Tax=Agrococcus pavilionensis RW1 TaxID=1330458 RepID=U1LMG1_9MICO|nr:hypothetical protein [Agrococcus pavilionensis]ERG63529.1 hypothetical protein L332_03550 [Agrococcus pavilionensis RW1]
MAGRKHLMAVNKAIRAAGLDESGVDAPTIELARDLARKIDAVGAENASTRLTDAYLSASGRLTRAAARVRSERERAERAASSGRGRAAPPAADEGAGAPRLELVEKSPLDAFLGRHKIGA